MRAPPNAAAAAATQPACGRGLFDAVKRARTGDALRYAGARLSTVGRRVVPSGRRIRLGDAVRIDEDARRVLQKERRPVGYPSMATLRQDWDRQLATRPHWSEVSAW